MIKIIKKFLHQKTVLGEFLNLHSVCNKLNFPFISMSVSELLAKRLAAMMETATAASDVNAMITSLTRYFQHVNQVFTDTRSACDSF